VQKADTKPLTKNILTLEKQQVEECFSSPSAVSDELPVGDNVVDLLCVLGLFPWKKRCLCFPPPAKLEKRRLECLTTLIHDNIERCNSKMKVEGFLNLTNHSNHFKDDKRAL
jgi:hypothetical protein